MKKILQLTATTALAAAISSVAYADAPTRGFYTENGKVAKQGTVSADISGNFNSGGVRIGLGFGELILNGGKAIDRNGFTALLSGLGDDDFFFDDDDFMEEFEDALDGVASSSDALFKVGLPALEGLSELKHHWAAYAGISMVNIKDGPDYTNLVAGLSFTAEVEKLELTVAPELVINDVIDETYVNLNFGGYFNVGETKFGTFKPGAEVIVSTLKDSDTLVAVGVQWGIKDNIHLDVVPLTLGGADTIAIPGQLRLNVEF